ncbi:MAG: DUF4153 domain-containing protein [Paludibacter sp.]
MKKLNFKSLTADLIAVVLRFPIVLIVVFGLAIMALLEINVKRFEPEFNVWSFFILSTIASFSVSLLLENTSKKILGMAVFVLTFASIALYCFAMFNHKIEWEMMQYAAMVFTAVLAITFALYFSKNSDSSFWIFTEKISREFITTLIYVSILQGGLGLAIYAVDVLFNVKVEHEVYGSLAVICYLIIAPVYFLMNVPTKNKLYNEPIEYNKFLKILGLNVFLPILGIYLVILYFYLFKIIIRWELPNGWVTTLVSVLALGGYVSKFLLFPLSDNKIVIFLNRYFSLLLLPLIVLMSIGLARRISDYGLSINRLYVLFFNVWLYGVSVYLFLTQSKHLRWLVISFAAVLFIASVGPSSVYAVTKRVIETEMTNLLVDSKLYVENKLIQNKDNKMAISDTVAVQLSDKIHYYYNTYGEQNWRTTFHYKQKNIGAYEITEYLGLNNSKTSSFKSKYIYANLSENRVVDINDYSKMLAKLEIGDNDSLIFKNKEYKVEIVNNQIQITNLKNNSLTAFPLQKIVSELYLNDENETANNKLLMQKKGECMLIINSFSADCKSITNFEIRELKFSVFVK